jgi:hypothetical protein
MQFLLCLESDDRDDPIRKTGSADQAELTREIVCPAAVPQWMDFHPNLSLPFAQLQSAPATGDSEMPVPAPSVPGQLAFTLDDKSVSAALVEGLSGGQPDIQGEQGRLPIVVGRSPIKHREPKAISET